MSDERDKVEKKSHVKLALIQPCLESTTSVSSDDSSDDVQETGKDTTKKPTNKKSPVVLPYIEGVSEQIRSVQAI